MSYRKPTAAAVALLCLSATLPDAAAQPTFTGDGRVYGAWRSSAFGGGGYVLNVVPTADAGVYYCHVDVGGLYRSNDGGWTWHALHGALPAARGAYHVRGVSVDPRDADHLLVAVGSRWGDKLGVYRSTDAGRTFTPTLQDADFDGNDRGRWAGAALARDPANPAVVLAGTLGDGVFRSTDGGATWGPAAAVDALVTDLDFDPHTPGRVHLCSMKGKRRDRDFPQPRSFQSVDGGATWRPLADEGPSEAVNHPTVTGRLIGVFDAQRVALSDDHGRTWRDVHDGLPINPKADDDGAYGYRALTADTRHVYVVNGRGSVFRLRPDATGWDRLPKATVDAGDWWGNVGQREGFVHFGAAASSLTIDPRDPQRWFLTDWYAIWQSTDAGASWKLSNEGVEFVVVHQVLQDIADPTLVHAAVADNGYLRSTDGGDHFTTLRGTGISNNIKDMAQSPADPQRLYAVGCAEHGWRSNALFVSTDRGLTWSRTPTPGLPDLNDKSRSCNTVVVDPRDAQRVVLAVSGDVGQGAGGPYLSTDGGVTWTWLGEGLPQGKPWFSGSIWKTGRELAAAPDGTLLTVSPRTGGVYKLRDGDTMWQRLDFEPQGAQFAVAADPHDAARFFVTSTGKGGGVCRTTDGGATWAQVSQPDGGATHIVVDRVTPGRVASTTPQGPILSTDGGRTWTPIYADLPHRSEGNMPAFAGDRLIVGSDGGGLFTRPLR